jgi:broad specificity phosphatase PhoE
MKPGQHIYLLRHGHSEFQTIYEATGLDPGIVDAPLSEQGKKQVREIASDVARLRVDLIVTSSLTRAIETALGALAGTSRAPIIVQPLLAERLGDSCDIGRPRSTLTREFSMLDFSTLSEHWWHDGQVDIRGTPVESPEQFEDRIVRFRVWLASRDEKTILLVSHHGVFKVLCGLHLANCQLQEMEPIDRKAFRTSVNGH